MNLPLTRGAAFLFLMPVWLEAAQPRRSVRVGGLPAAASTGTSGAWHWVEGSARDGGRALQSGESAGARGVSWLEMQVRGPDRLYFSCRTEYERLTVTLPNFEEGYLNVIPFLGTNWPLHDVRIASSEPVNHTTTASDFDVRTPSPGYSILQPFINPTPFTPALRFWLGRNELTLPALVTAANHSTATAECLTTDLGWSEYRVSIPRGVHRLRWEFHKSAFRAKATLLDGVRLESAAAVTITSPREATLCAGKPCRVAVQSNRQGRTFTAQDLPDGLRLDAASGLLTGTVAAPGIHSATVTARDARGSSHTIPLRLEVQADAGIALDESHLTWTQGREDYGPALPCDIETTAAPDGLDALRINSGAWLETEVTGPDKLSFAWRPNTDRWNLALTLDGQAVTLPEPGSSIWQRQTLDIPAGKHRVRWRSLQRFDGGYWYHSRQGFRAPVSMSDGYVSHSLWNGYSWSSVLLDDVRLESRPRPVLERPPLMVATADSEFVQRFAARGAVSVTASGLPAGILLSGSPNEQSVALTGTPATAGEYTVRIAATGTGGMTEVATSLRVLPPLAPALDSMGLTWRTGSTGGMGWEAVNASPQEYWRLPRDGEDAVWANSFTPGDANQTAWIETTVTGPDTLHFFWKRRDYAAPEDFQLLLDGAPVPGLVAPVSWQGASVVIPPGEHVLRWVVTAGGVTSALDQVRLASDGRAFPLNEESIACTALRPFTKALTFSRTPDSITLNGDLPPGLTLSDSGVLSGAAVSSGSWQTKFTAHTAAGAVSGHIAIHAAPPCLPDWLAAKQLAGSSLASDTDGDGLTIFMEFALGGDPLKPEFNFAPRLTRHEHGISWEFPRGDYDANTALVTVQYSTDLKLWTPVHCWAGTDDAGLPVHRGTLHWSPLPSQLYFRIRAEVPLPGRD